MTELVRWGILGTGKIARSFATALVDVPGAQLAAVASRSSDKAAAFGAEFGASSSYGSYEALLAASDIDLVYIATPHPQHAANIRLALEAGKGVLCEKPFTMNRREAAPLVALAHAKKLFLMEAMWTRYLPCLAEVQRLVAAGEIGEPRQIVADFGFVANFGPEHRVYNPDLGGGALLDLGIYPLSIAAALLGPVVDIKAHAQMGPTGVDVQTAFSLTHVSGTMSVSSCSFLARTPGELTVSGTRGHIRMNTMFHRARSVTVVRDDGSTRVIDTPFIGNGYPHEVIEAQRCWQAGLLESPAMTHAETLDLMGVMDEIRRQIGLEYAADQL